MQERDVSGEARQGRFVVEKEEELMHGGRGVSAQEREVHGALREGGGGGNVDGLAGEVDLGGS